MFYTSYIFRFGASACSYSIGARPAFDKEIEGESQFTHDTGFESIVDLLSKLSL